MNINFKIQFLIFVGLTSFQSYSQSTNWKQGIIEEQFIYDTAPFPSCHAATITETPEGLVSAWFGGTKERHPDVGIWLSRKINNQWSTPIEVANGIINDTLRYPTWNPVLFQIPGRELLLFFKIGPSPSTWWGMIMRSKDNGITWDTPERLPDGFLGPIKNKPVLLSNGNLICPSSTEGNGWNIHLELSPDSGKTWQMLGPVDWGDSIQSIQPSILVHKGGKLQVLCRSKNRVIAQSWSEDMGKTWSPLSALAMPNNNSGTDAVTLADGRHFLVYNHVKPPEGQSKGARTPLNVAVSEDGIEWYATLVLEDSEISQYSYPSVIQSADGMVHIVYTWRREKIKYVKVDPNQLILKKIENEKWPN